MRGFHRLVLLATSGVGSALASPAALAQELGSSPAPLRAETADDRAPAWPSVIVFEPNTARATQGPGERQVTIHIGQELRFELDASDPDGDAITYASPKIPEHASFDARRGAFDWRTLPDDRGVHHLRFSASAGAKTSVLDIQVHVVPNQPPDQSVAEEMSTQFFNGDHVRYRLVEDHDGDPLQLTTLSLPKGAILRVDGSDLWFEWTPTPRDVGTHELAFLVSDGDFQTTIRKTVYVHPDWDSTSNKTYFAPSVGYLVNAPSDRRLLMGPSAELTFFAIRRGGYETYTCDHRTTAECAPSHHRFYVAFETLFPVGHAGSSAGSDGALFTYALGFTRSFEFAPDRRWLIPHYGLEVGAMTGSPGGTVAEVTPFLGMHVWTDRHIWLNFTAGARVVPAEIEARSGPRAGLSLMVDAW